MAILIGLLLGLSTLLFIGPVFLYTMRSSIEGGFKAGLSVALGILVGDIICIAIVLANSTALRFIEDNKAWIALAGSLVLLIMGISYLIKKGEIKAVNEKLTNSSLLFYFFNGFIVNFVNPFVFAAWFSFIAFTKSKLIYSNEVLLCLIVSLVTIFVIDVLKAKYAQKLLFIVRPILLSKIFKGVGVVMLIFSIRLFYYFVVS